MSAPYTHCCGARIDARVHWNGAAYAVAFHGPDTGAALEYCPGCGESLACALRDGDLTDDQGRRTPPDRSRHP